MVSGGMRARGGSKVDGLDALLTVALCWALSGAETLIGRLAEALKVAPRRLPWRPSPGRRYQGFIKHPRRWHVELMICCTGVPHVAERRYHARLRLGW